MVQVTVGISEDPHVEDVELVQAWQCMGSNVFQEWSRVEFGPCARPRRGGKEAWRKKWVIELPHGQDPLGERLKVLLLVVVDGAEDPRQYFKALWRVIRVHQPGGNLSPHIEEPGFSKVDALFPQQPQYDGDVSVCGPLGEEAFEVGHEEQTERLRPAAHRPEEVGDTTHNSGEDERLCPQKRHEFVGDGGKYLLGGVASLQGVRLAFEEGARLLQRQDGHGLEGILGEG